MECSLCVSPIQCWGGVPFMSPGCCGSFFHCSCMDSFVAQSREKSCPNCRASFPTSSLPASSPVLLTAPSVQSNPNGVQLIPMVPRRVTCTAEVIDQLYRDEHCNEVEAKELKRAWILTKPRHEKLHKEVYSIFGHKRGHKLLSMLLSKIKETKRATISTQWQSHMMVQLVQVQTLQQQLLQAHIENHAKRRRVGSFGSADSHLFQFKESSDEVDRAGLVPPLLKSLTPSWTATAMVSPNWGSGDSLSSLDESIKQKVGTHLGPALPTSSR